MIQRAPLPALRNRIRIGAQLVRLKARQVFALSIKHTHMRTEKFVSGAGQKIAIQLSNVNRPVWRVMDCIDIRHRAGLMREAHNRLHVINRSHRVRRVSNCNDFRPRSNFAGQIIHVDGAVVLVDVRELDLHPALFQCAPRGNIGIVIEMGK